jgi:hypothetical protein
MPPQGVVIQQSSHWFIEVRHTPIQYTNNMHIAHTAYIIHSDVQTIPYLSVAIVLGSTFAKQQQQQQRSMQLNWNVWCSIERLFTSTQQYHQQRSEHDNNEHVYHYAWSII